MNASGTTEEEVVSTKFATLSGESGTLSNTYIVQPSGEKRRCQLIMFRRRYGGSERIPECQNAKIDLEPGVGGLGVVRASGSAWGSIGGAISYGGGTVLGMRGYNIVVRIVGEREGY